MFEQIFQHLIIKRPGVTLAFVLVLCAFLSVGISNFKLDASSDSLTLESDRSLDYFREITARYNTGDILVVTYKPKTDLFSDESLENLAALKKELSAVQGITSSLSILDVPLLYSPKIGFTSLSSDLPTLSDGGIDQGLALAEFHNSPIYKDTLVGPDNQTTAILLNLAVDQELIGMVRERDALALKDRRHGLDQEETETLKKLRQEYLDARTQATQVDFQRVANIRQIVESYKEGAELFVGGTTMITSDMVSFIQSDLVIFGSGILIFIIGSLIVIFRQFKLVLIPLLTCLVTALSMLGYLGWVDWRLTVISSNFISLLLIITMAITIHLLVRFQELSANTDWSLHKVVSETVRQMARPCLYTALTTIVAFASLVVSDIRPVIDFGWMMTIGVIAALTFTFVVVPAGLLFFKVDSRQSAEDTSGRYMKAFAGIVENYPKAVPLIALCVALLAAFGVSQLKVENRFIDYFKSDTEIHQGMLVIDHSLGGTMNLDLVLDAPAYWFDVEEDEFSFDDDFASEDEFGFDEGFELDQLEDGGENSGQTVLNSENSAQLDSYWWARGGIKIVERYHDFLEAQPEIGKVNSIATGYKVARDLVGEELNDIELAFMRKSLGDDLQDVLLKPYLDDEVQQVRISARVKESVKGLSREELIARVKAFGSEELDLKEEQIQVTGLIVLYNNMLQSLFGSQIQTLVAVFIGIMLMFLVLFRSLLISVIALAPNALAASVVLGVMGLAGIPLDIMTITIAAITVGMGVDHAIHYIHRFKTEFSVSQNYLTAMHASHSTIGRALVYTAITIIVGFSVLALSNFMPSIYFGLLTSLAMLAATFGSLTLLPRLIVMSRPFD